MRFKVRAPASSANLGPGFDALGLALDLWNEIEITTDGDNPSVEIGGADAALLDGKENYTLLAMKELAQLYYRKLPPFSIRVKADIPVARGLGSSAAALVSGLIAANRLLNLQLSRTELFQQAWQMEGHGDNVGAAIYGGAVLAVAGVNDALCLSNGATMGLTPVVFIPEATSATWAARAALPSSVPHPDAAYNVGMAAGLSVGLLTGNREAIAAGMHDRLHEPYRARLFSHLTPMTDAARSAGAIGACLSGAGPTILVLTEPERVERLIEVLRAVATEHGVAGDARALPATDRGAYLIELD
jgi:homoserine kinase